MSTFPQSKIVCWQVRLERVPIVQALASLKAAEAVTWVPYGMLRDPVIPVNPE